LAVNPAPTGAALLRNQAAAAVTTIKITPIPINPIFSQRFITNTPLLNILD
jgi:hypothetical protein